MPIWRHKQSECLRFFFLSFFLPFSPSLSFIVLSCFHASLSVFIFLFLLFSLVLSKVYVPILFSFLQFLSLSLPLFIYLILYSILLPFLFSSSFLFSFHLPFYPLFISHSIISSSLLPDLAFFPNFFSSLFTNSIFFGLPITTHTSHISPLFSFFFHLGRGWGGEDGEGRVRDLFYRSKIDNF